MRKDTATGTDAVAEALVLSPAYVALYVQVPPGAAGSVTDQEPLGVVTADAAPARRRAAGAQDGDGRSGDRASAGRQRAPHDDRRAGDRGRRGDRAEGRLHERDRRRDRRRRRRVAGLAGVGGPVRARADRGSGVRHGVVPVRRRRGRGRPARCPAAAAEHRDGAASEASCRGRQQAGDRHGCARTDCAGRGGGQRRRGEDRRRRGRRGGRVDAVRGDVAVYVMSPAGGASENVARPRVRDHRRQRDRMPAPTRTSEREPGGAVGSVVVQLSVPHGRAAARTARELQQQRSPPPHQHGDLGPGAVRVPEDRVDLRARAGRGVGDRKCPSASVVTSGAAPGLAGRAAAHPQHLAGQRRARGGGQPAADGRAAPRVQGVGPAASVTVAARRRHVEHAHRQARRGSRSPPRPAARPRTRPGRAAGAARTSSRSRPSARARSALAVDVDVRLVRRVEAGDEGRPSADQAPAIGYAPLG